MLQHIKASIFRIYKKKSMRYYLVFLSLGFIVVHLIMKTQVNKSSFYVIATQAMLSLSTLFIGTYLFGVIYSDDINSKTDLVSIGTGHKRSTLILSRFITSVLVVLVIVILMLLHVLILPVVLGYGLSSSLYILLIQQVMLEGLKIVAYMALASIVSYWTQKNTFATTTYLVFTSGIINSIILLLTNFNSFNELYMKFEPYLLSTLIMDVEKGINMNKISSIPILGIGLYLCLFVDTSIIVYSKKDLEF